MVRTSKPRGLLIAGNWKMNHGLKDTHAFFGSLPPLSSLPGLKVAVFPPFLSLSRALELAPAYGVAVGAQNVHWDLKGAFTGEISGPMLEEIGVSWALVGHSERRQHFGETDATAHKRTASLLTQDFHVILCIGETRAEREAGRTNEVLISQLRGAFGAPESAATLASHLGGKLVIAYEPVWAIGTGLTATPVQAEEAHLQIRSELAARFTPAVAQKAQLLYGGSVTPENVDALLACPNIDGALVGGASLKPEGFAALVEAGARALR
jgi:triosephosphate isomerase